MIKFTSKCNYIMITIQFREAIAQAMSEEMRRDDTIYLWEKKLPNIMVLTRHPREC